MATNKNTIKPGRLLKNEDGVCIYDVSTLVNVWADPGSVDQVTAAFSGSSVAVRLVRGQTSYQEMQVSQVVLSRDDFKALIASYRAFERAEKKRPVTVSDDFDPFLDDDEEVPVNGAGVEVEE